MTSTSDDASVPGLTRRRALGGAATVGLTLPLLSACSDDVPAPAPSSATSSEPGESLPERTSEPTPEATDEPTADSGSEALASTDDIPVGGGVVYTDSRVVVTQPEAGEFRCFSAVCTHSGCLVSGVSTSITCSCHASSFDLATGEVLGGPAPAPLPAVAFTIDKDQVVLS